MPPIAAALVLMIGFKWAGGGTGAAGRFTARVVPVTCFGAHPNLLAATRVKGMHTRPVQRGGTMQGFFQTHAKALRYTSLVAMVVLPFLLYFFAVRESTVGVHVFLGLMGMTMLLALKVG